MTTETTTEPETAGDELDGADVEPTSWVDLIRTSLHVGGTAGQILLGAYVLADGQPGHLVEVTKVADLIDRKAPSVRGLLPDLAALGHLDRDSALSDSGGAVVVFRTNQLVAG